MLSAVGVMHQYSLPAALPAGQDSSQQGAALQASVVCRVCVKMHTDLKASTQLTCVHWIPATAH